MIGVLRARAYCEWLEVGSRDCDEEDERQEILVDKRALTCRNAHSFKDSSKAGGNAEHLGLMCRGEEGGAQGLQNDGNQALEVLRSGS